MTRDGALSPAVDEQSERWLHDGESLLCDRLDDLDDASVPSLLPGWCRGHVLAHLAGNAAALGNLLHWARTGIETPMYASNNARAEQIQRDAVLDLPELLTLVRQTSANLRAAYDALTSRQRAVRVRTAQGRDRAAGEVAWMRARESFLHLVDLDIGFQLQDLPPAFIDAVLTDASDTIGRRLGHGIVLAPTDRTREWAVGSVTGDSARITGTAAHLLGYLIGRPGVRGPGDSTWPPLPAWL